MLKKIFQEHLVVRDLKSGWLSFGAFLAAAVVLALAAQRGTPGSLLPHGYCFTWNPTLLWTHVVSDTLIGLAYVSIPVTLLYLVRRRPDVRFDWIVLLFALFIVSCGATHWIEVWTVWHPDYWLSGSVKVVTAGASVLTAAALVGLVPRLVSIPTMAQLEAAKRALEVEVGHRRAAEEALLAERSELERRVKERTHQLDAATRSAEAAHARAEEANRLKDQFLAKVSHELRTPLQSTLSWAQLLQTKSLDPEKSSRAAERILHNVRTQARLIDDLLDISRILSGKLRLELERVDAASLIDRAVEVVRSSSAARGIHLELLHEEGPDCTLETDPVRLEQIIWNLANNAVQASADGGRVRIRVWVEGQAFRMEVRDWGCGVDPGDLEHLFEPFRQSRAIGSGSHRGLGLGLAISRSIADMLGGELTAASDGLGQGATFALVLPLVSSPSARQDSLAQATALSPDERSRLAGLRVVYVEDEPDIADSGRLMLESLGVIVEMCLTFEAAHKRLQSGGFDVLLSDLDLGAGHTAFELIRHMGSVLGLSKVPALVLSAFGSLEDRAQTTDAGFAAHLVKPADAVLVARALLAATGR